MAKELRQHITCTPQSVSRREVVELAIRAGERGISLIDQAKEIEDYINGPTIIENGKAVTIELTGTIKDPEALIERLGLIRVIPAEDDPPPRRWVCSAKKAGFDPCTEDDQIHASDRFSSTAVVRPCGWSS